MEWNATGPLHRVVPECGLDVPFEPSYKIPAQANLDAQSRSIMRGRRFACLLSAPEGCRALTWPTEWIRMNVTFDYPVGDAGANAILAIKDGEKLAIISRGRVPLSGVRAGTRLGPRRQAGPVMLQARPAG